MFLSFEHRNASTKLQPLRPFVHSFLLVALSIAMSIDHHTHGDWSKSRRLAPV